MTTQTPDIAEDICAPTLVRRIAALLDHDPMALRLGDAMPRGWHVALFTEATRQSRLRADGLAGLGATLPDLGLPRIMAAGRRLRFPGDIHLGDTVRRESRITNVAEKQGRSGRFALVTVEHRIFARGETDPVLLEAQDYVMRPAADPAAPPPPPHSTQPAPADHARIIVPDTTMLLRYCAITFNTHRIHYDQPYATTVENYPALVVNGGIPVLFLLDLFRTCTGREPCSCDARNIAPLYCGRELRLALARDGEGWRLWAEDALGNVALRISVE